MSKHIPGPYIMETTVDDDGDGSWLSIDFSVKSDRGPYQITMGTLTENLELPTEATEATVRLLAASPDLYDALYFLVHNTIPFDQAIALGRAALDKVHGEQE